jgi:hypothetical protein
MNINKEWHKKHKMPKNPNLKERMEWHIEHAENCSCYPMSDKLKAEINKYKSN